MSPARYQVDMAMLRRSVAEASAGDLEPFCANLQDEVSGGEVVATFRAVNDPRDMELVCRVWPTDPEWRRAVERTFGVITLPTARERQLRALTGR